MILQLSSLLFLLPLVECVSSLIYDEELGFKAMYYTAATYCNKSDLIDWNCGEPCNSPVSNFTPIENSLLNTFGYVAFNDVDN